MNDMSVNSPPQGIKQITAAICASVATEINNKVPKEYRDAVREELATKMLKENGISAFGQTISNQISADEQGRTEFIINKYGRTAAGATLLCTLTDHDTKETYVLLGRKHLNPKNPEAGLGQFICPGGYMNPKPTMGSANPENYDENLEAAARRELKEETGMVLPDNYKMTSLGVDSNVINNAGVHTVNEFFHVNLVGKPEDLAKFMPSDDLADLQLINSKQLLYDEKVGVQPDGSNVSRYSVLTKEGIISVRDLHVDYIQKAISIAQKNISQDVVANDNKWQKNLEAQREMAGVSTGKGRS